MSETMYAGWYHRNGGWDDDFSYAEVVGTDPEAVMEWLMDEHDIDDCKWLGSLDAVSGLSTHGTRPNLHVKEVEVLTNE